MDKLFTLNNINYRAPRKSALINDGGEKMILDNISLEFERGEILGIAGESGSGKTTLGKIIAGVITNFSGEMVFNFKDEWKRTRTSPVQILFQNNGEILNPFRKVYDAVKEAYLIRYGVKKDVPVEIEKIFKSLNFSPDLWYRKGYELSGGEQQRAALARILAAKPELLILDEPFSAQDPESQINIAELIGKIKNEFNISFICISHNIKLLRLICSRIAVMYEGKIVEIDSTENVFNSPEHTYTKFLLKAENYNLKYDELISTISELKSK